MKFLLDVCVSSRSLETFLAGRGHDVLSAVAVDPRASDERLLGHSQANPEAFAWVDG